MSIYVSPADPVKWDESNTIASALSIGAVTTVYSSALRIPRSGMVGITIAITNAATDLTAAISAQVTNDAESAIVAGTATWYDYAALPTINVAAGVFSIGGGTTSTVELIDLPWHAVRMKIVTSACAGGVATTTMKACVKAQG